jgi:hypothetical protein
MAFFIFPLISARDLDIGPRVGFYNAIKTLAFASYFCKMRVKFLYWSPTGELIFSEYFHSITERIFHFKIRLWFSGLLNHTIDSDIKVLNHVLLTLADGLCCGTSDNVCLDFHNCRYHIFYWNNPEFACVIKA